MTARRINERARARELNHSVIPVARFAITFSRILLFSCNIGDTRRDIRVLRAGPTAAFGRQISALTIVSSISRNDFFE